MPTHVVTCLGRAAVHLDLYAAAYCTYFFTMAAEYPSGMRISGTYGQLKRGGLSVTVWPSAGRKRTNRA